MVLAGRADPSVSGRVALALPYTAAVTVDDLVLLGQWPRLAAQILRARLETAGITVTAVWSDSTADTTGALYVPADQAEFAEAVITELDVDDEVPDTSPHAYIVRLEEHLSAAAELLQELRTQLDALEAEERR
jgi:hypothetical protein